MKAYVINLERSVDRREHMDVQLKPFTNICFEYIQAVDGRLMTKQQIRERFNEDKFKDRNSYFIRPGEIGCTLSHQKCYRKMVEDNEPYVLILEDDIKVSDYKLTNKGIEEIEHLCKNAQEPLIVLLSGWYWYKDVKKLSSDINITSVYDAFLTHSYVINQAAAKLLIEERPYITADDWIYIRKKGVNLKAVLPHLIDQNWEGVLSTTVNEVPIKGKSIPWFVRNLFRLIYLKYLLFTGRFEKA